MTNFYLDILYSIASDNGPDAMEILFITFPHLLKHKKYAEVDGILKEVDVTRLPTGTLYGIVHLTSNYINQLSEYRTFHQRVQDEYLRRGEQPKRVYDLLHKYKDGGNHLHDDNAPPYKSPEEKSRERLDARIQQAQEQSDKELYDFLRFYKEELKRYEDRREKFNYLRKTLGEEGLRTATIRSLREVASLLETTSGCMPGIYYVELPDNPLLKQSFIDGIEVVVSYPWPG